MSVHDPDMTIERWFEQWLEHENPGTVWRVG